MKKFIFILIPMFLINILLLFFLYKHDEEEPIIIIDNKPEEEVVIDNNVYETLSLTSFYVYNYGSPKETKISWYLKDNEHYLFLPKLIDRNNVCVEFAINTETITYLSIYDTKNNLLDKITTNKCTNAFKNDEVVLKLETNVKNPKSYKVKVIRSELPSMYLTVEGGNAAYKQIINSKNHSVSKPGFAVVADENNNIVSGELKEIKGRGNRTWERPKKPFQLKFEDKVSVLGMKEAKTWLLLNNYLDGSLSRNYLYYTFARELGLEYSVELETVEVYINNNYNGVYLVTSKIEAGKNRVDTDEYIFEVDNHVDVDQIKLAKGNIITIHYPELDKMDRESVNKVKKDAKKYLNNLESMMDNQKIKSSELEKYLDYESFAKYYWVQEMAINFDAQRGSNYIYVKDGKAYAGPIWDFDNTLNRSYYYAPITGYFLLNNATLNSRIRHNWFKGLMKRQEFSDVVDRIFVENIKTFENIYNNLVKYEKYINTSAKMNYIRWPYGDMKKYQPNKQWLSGDKNYETSMNLLKKNLKKRLDWYKKQYENVMFNEFRYEIVDKKEVVASGKINGKTSLSKSINNDAVINIYGKNDKKEVKIKSITVKEALNGKFSVRVSSKTGISSKKNNSMTYDFEFYEGGK